jgi:hypothetical protein
VISRIQLARLRFCWSRCIRRGTTSLLCVTVLACGHGKVRSVKATQIRGGEEPGQAALGLDRFFLHDECTGEYPPQPDTCLHAQRHEHSFKFGGKAGTAYQVDLRIRGIFEPTTIIGGDTPDPAHPYFKVGGTIGTQDWSQWRIEVSQPRQTFWLNHYPSVAHKIYKEDFEVSIIVAAGATVVIGVNDGNDRQIDNGKTGPDRKQILDGVTDRALSGQMLRIDVVRVKSRQTRG